MPRKTLTVLFPPVLSGPAREVGDLAAEAPHHDVVKSRLVLRDHGDGFAPLASRPDDSVKLVHNAS